MKTMRVALLAMAILVSSRGSLTAQAPPRPRLAVALLRLGTSNEVSTRIEAAIKAAMLKSDRIVFREPTQTTQFVIQVRVAQSSCGAMVSALVMASHPTLGLLFNSDSLWSVDELNLQRIATTIVTTAEQDIEQSLVR